MQYTTPFLRVAGSPAERGAAIGAAFADRIGAATEFYARMFGLPPAELERQGAYFAEVIGGFRPAFAAEIEACADAAGIAAHRLFAMNARSELLSSGLPECTAISFRKAALLAQTWDWLEDFESLFVVVSHEFDDGHSLLTVTEPGMLAKIGLNGSAIGTCLNFLMSQRRWTHGVPVHAFLRAILECRTWTEIEALTRDHADGVVGNMMTASAAGQRLNIEGAPDRAYLSAPEEDAFVHTNHYLQIDETGPMDIIGNSVGRLAAACTLIADERRGLAEIKEILSDGRLGPILVPYTPFQDLSIGTVCTVVMELEARRLHVRRGPDAGAPFTTYELETSTPSS